MKFFEKFGKLLKRQGKKHRLAELNVFNVLPSNINVEMRYFNKIRKTHIIKNRKRQNYKRYLLKSSNPTEIFIIFHFIYSILSFQQN